MRRVYLHIGLQKSGTTYLQRVLWHHRTAVAAQGLDLVPGSPRATFDLMLDVRRRLDPAVDRPRAATALARLPAQLAAAPGDRALITEEALAEAWSPRIEALLAACAEREAHLLLTVRDLGRQVPSAWQQMLQTGGTTTFEAYLARLRERGPRNEAWANKDLVALLTRWGRHLPASRIHVVTVPPAGGDPEELLRRFCRVLDLDPAGLDTRSAGRVRDNRSLGRVEAEVLRRVNGRLDATHLRRDVYGDVGKRFFATRVLGTRPGRRILLPARDEAWLRAVSADAVAHLRTGGYDVVGDPDDLLPAADAFGDPDAGRPTEAEVADRTTEALAAVLGDRMDTVRAGKAERRAARAAARDARAAERAAEQTGERTAEQTAERTAEPTGRAAREPVRRPVRSPLRRAVRRTRRGLRRIGSVARRGSQPSARGARLPWRR